MIDSRVVGPQPKIKDGKLVAKARIVGKGFQDTGRFDQRNDSPTCSRTTFMVFLTMILSFCWEGLKVDITGAFLNEVKIARKNLWIKMPQMLVEYGLLMQSGFPLPPIAEGSLRVE